MLNPLLFVNDYRITNRKESSALYLKLLFTASY